jgi:hypothetical protein
MPKKNFTQLEGTRRRGRPRKGWREEVERDLQVLGVRRWRELAIRKNGEVLFDRPKLTAGCSAKGRRRRTQPTLCSINKIKFLDPVHQLLLKKKAQIFGVSSTVFCSVKSQRFLDSTHSLIFNEVYAVSVF